MTCSDHATHLTPAPTRLSASLPQAFGALLSQALAKVGAFIRARRNRRAIFELAQCDDRMLKDLGLSRSAVEGALAAGFEQDPSALLQRPSPSDAVERAARLAWARGQG